MKRNLAFFAVVLVLFSCSVDGSNGDKDVVDEGSESRGIDASEYINDLDIKVGDIVTISCPYLLGSANAPVDDHIYLRADFDYKKSTNRVHLVKKNEIDNSSYWIIRAGDGDSYQLENFNRGFLMANMHNQGGKKRVLMSYNNNHDQDSKWKLIKKNNKYYQISYKHWKLNGDNDADHLVYRDKPSYSGTKWVIQKALKPTEITFKDINLETYIRYRKLNKPTGKIEKRELESIENIEIYDRDNVKNLEGLQACTNLKKFRLYIYTRLNIDPIINNGKWEKLIPKFEELDPTEKPKPSRIYFICPSGKEHDTADGVLRDTDGYKYFGKSH